MMCEYPKLIIYISLHLIFYQHFQYREVDLLIDPLKASNSQKQRVCTVVTHELAHQWFGNLVTMNWWDDLVRAI